MGQVVVSGVQGCNLYGCLAGWTGQGPVRRARRAEVAALPKAVLAGAGGGRNLDFLVLVVVEDQYRRYLSTYIDDGRTSNSYLRKGRHEMFHLIWHCWWACMCVCVCVYQFVLLAPALTSGHAPVNVMSKFMLLSFFPPPKS